MKIKWWVYALAVLLAGSQELYAQQAQVRTDGRTSSEVNAQDARNYMDPGLYGAFNVNYLRNYEGDDGFNGMGLNGRIGYDINQYFAVEAESGWMFYNAESDNIDAGTLNIVPLLGNIIGKYPVTEELVPYASGGFGVFFFGFNESDQLERAGAEIDFDNAAVGFKAAVGADYWFQPNWALNFETGYYFIPDPDVRGSVAGTKFAGEGEVDAWFVGGGLKYKFA